MKVTLPEEQVLLSYGSFYIQADVLTVKLNTADSFKASTAEYLWTAFIYVCQCIKYLLLWKRVLVRIWAFVNILYERREVFFFIFSLLSFLAFAHKLMPNRKIFTPY